MYYKKWLITTSNELEGENSRKLTLKNVSTRAHYFFLLVKIVTKKQEED